jgi:hypothetical protein
MMRKLAINKISFVLMLLALMFMVACKKDYSQPEKNPIGIGIDNAYVLKGNYISHNGADLIVDLDIGVVGTGSAIDITSIPDSAFKNKFFGNHELTIMSLERIQMNESKSYSNLLVIDMSGDWNEIDLFNLRTRAFNKTVFETLSNSNNEIALGTFDRSNGAFVETRDNKNPYQLTYEEYGKLLFNFYYRKGTTSNLYDAIGKYLEYVNIQTNHVNKNITVVVRSTPDNQNSETVNSLITKANTYGIKINLIVFNGGSNWSMYNLATKTGGFLNIIGSTSQFNISIAGLMDKGTPMLGSIHRLLSNDVFVYRLHLNLKKPSGLWTSGSLISDPYETNLNYADGSFRLNNYLPFYVKIP